MGKTMDITLVVFPPKHVDWQRCHVKGYVYDSRRQRWILRRTPIPDVVYDRYIPHDLQTARVISCRRAFQMRGIPIFNPPFGGKYGVYRRLLNDPAIAPHLPETRLLMGERGWSSRLAAWRKVYLKPDKGSKGKGIIRMSLAGEEEVVVEPTGGQRQYLRRKAAWRWLKSRTLGQRYLIQRAIEPACWKGRIYDLRVLVQREMRGQWEVTGGSARVTGNGITCNLHTGASAAPLSEALAESGVEVTAEQVFALSLRIAHALSRHYPGLAELGLDFLVDREGRVWFLEANSRPGRSIFSRIGDLQGRLTAVRRPLEYARYLAGKEAG
ncbi:hypothetical protein GTO91_02365 [Heliobacterium undosum]|uniref:ATP-grasp domain-containing protein n=1 Tax=Heliomicrobium undosum TaxID=121734 RepID=A0A845L0W0_9FIRM|nr:YheC/YheD family protein [Heliomicrobium undosum]MZP28569.1 hypothetical protein [Heliomicrobium undosum]